MNPNDEGLLIKQLADLAANCRDYTEMQAEILALLGGYTKGLAHWGNAPKKIAEHKIDLLSPSGESLTLQRENQPYGNTERKLAESCLPVLILLNRLKRERLDNERQRQSQLIKSVMDTLSYSELEVVVRIFEALDAPEGRLIAGKIADKMGITRSVVVSALRKLESACIIETRSLGVKGTYIRVLNPLWLQEIRKLKV